MLPERLLSSKNKSREQKGKRGTEGEVFRVGAEAVQSPSFLFWFYFLGLSHPFYPLLIICSPSLCSLSPHFLPTLFISLPSNPSLFIPTLSLSPSIWWNSAADNACNWSDSHFSSVFGPDKEYCQHFADMASAGRIKWTVLFCLQQIKSLSIDLFSLEAHRGLLFTQKRRGEGEEEKKGDFPLSQEVPIFSFSSSLHSVTVRWRGGEREVKTDSPRRGGKQLWR